jgi:hypothetical protein
MLLELYKKIPNWGKIGVVCIAVGYFIGRNSVPVHTETTTDKVVVVEKEKNEEETKSTEESTTKKTGPVIIVREETRPDGTKIVERTKQGGTKEETKRKEDNSKKVEEKTKVVEVIKEVKVTEPFPSYSIGAHIKAPVDEITSNHLKKELDVTAGYRVYKKLWLEGVVSSPLDFKKPALGVGFRVEF